jgi:hypothetical protein
LCGEEPENLADDVISRLTEQLPDMCDPDEAQDAAEAAMAAVSNSERAEHDY